MDPVKGATSHLADNVHFKRDEGYVDASQPSRYLGPWQSWLRDIDPTHWLRKTSDSGGSEWGAEVWWRPFEYKFDIASDDMKNSWCSDPEDLPKFKDLIMIPDSNNQYWYTLHGFSQWREKEQFIETGSLRRELWYRLNSIVVAQADLDALQEELRDESYISPDFVSVTSTGHQGFLREYPWHPSVDSQDQFEENESWVDIKTPHSVPYAQYEWELGSNDQSAEINLRLMLPSSYLVERMSLRYNRSRFDQWINEEGRVTFFDPSIEYDGPSFGILDATSANEMLLNNNLVLVWLIGGEKMIGNDFNLDARMVFNMMLWTNGDGAIHETSHHYME